MRSALDFIKNQQIEKQSNNNKDIVSCFSIYRNMKNNISFEENNTSSIGNQGGEGCLMGDPELFKSNIIRSYVPMYL